MILRPSYLHNGIFYTDKITYSYWIRALHTVLLCFVLFLVIMPVPIKCIRSFVVLHFVVVILSFVVYLLIYSTMFIRVASLALTWLPQCGWSDQEDAMVWKCFPYYRPFVRGILQSQVVSNHKGPVVQSFDALFATSKNKLLNKQLRSWWFEMLRCSCRCNYFEGYLWKQQVSNHKKTKQFVNNFVHNSWV